MGWRKKVIVCGHGGINKSENNLLIPESDLIEATNISTEASTWKRLPGAYKYNTTVISGAPKITALHAFQLSVSQKIVAATDDGKLSVIDVGGVSSVLKSGLGTGAQSYLTEAFGANSVRKVFHFNGFNPVQVWDGIEGVSSDIALPPSDWSGSNHPAVGVVHNNRLFAFGNINHPYRLYYSAVTDHEDFQGSGSGTLNVYPGEGSKLVAAVSFIGRLFLFKYPNGIYWLDDSDPSDSNWVIKKLTDSVGMAGPHGLCQITKDVLFMGSDGFVHFLSGIKEFGDAMSSVVLPQASGELLRSTVAKDKLHLAKAIFYKDKGHVYIGVPTEASTYNNAVIMLDVSRTRARMFWNDRDSIVSATTAKDINNKLRPLIGDNAGFAWFMDGTGTSKGGAAYTSKFRTKDIPLFIDRRANLKQVEIIFQHENIHTLTLKVYRDGIPKETYSVTATHGFGTPLGSFVLGTSKLGAPAISRWRDRLVGDCNTISIEGYESGVDTNFSISEIRIYYNDGNDRL
jgi:hypothetical protein